MHPPLDLCALFDRAVSEGALLFYHSTTVVRRGDHGRDYRIVCCPGLGAKAACGTASPATNPFLPYSRDLFVAQVQPAHVLLFNKFSVVRPHLLLVTAEYHEQDAELSKDDFVAVQNFYALHGPDYIMFYNCGPRSGASQPHRHFQFVPEWENCKPVAGTVVPCRVEDLFATYQRLPKSPSFNLLYSPSWGLCMVHRKREHCSLGLSLNALAFLGCLLVKSDEDLARCQAADLQGLIQEVTDY